MTFLIFSHVALSILGAVVLVAAGLPDPALSFIAGAGLSLFNLVALTVTWPRILAKKLFALSIGVIVFKFAILGWIIYEVVTGNVFQLGWFSMGLGVVVPSVLITSIAISNSRPSEVLNAGHSPERY